MLYTEMTKANCEALVKMSTGKRIKQILDNRRLTQKDLALKIGVTKTSVSHWIRGENEMGISQLAKISQELNVSADWLLGLENE